MNVNFKIEAKKVVNPIILKNGMPELKLSEALNLLYETFSKDTFMLPYKVKKLSKRARRNQI